MALIDEILRTVFEPVAGRDRKMANPDQYAGPIKQLANIVERYERIASDIRESDTQEQLQSLRKPVYSSHQEEQILQLLRKKTERTKLLECNMLTIQKIAHRTARYRRSEIFEQHTIPQPDTPPENIYTDWMNRYPERIFLENIQNIMQHVEEGIRYKYASVKDDHANAKKCLLISDSHNALASQALIDVAEHTENLGLAATNLAQLHQKLLALGPNFGLISKAAPEQHFTQ